MYNYYLVFYNYVAEVAHTSFESDFHNLTSFETVIAKY